MTDQNRAEEQPRQMTEYGVPFDLIHAVDEQPRLKARLYTFLQPWIHPIKPPGVDIFNSYFPPDRPGYQLEPSSLGPDDTEAIITRVSTLTDNSLQAIKFLADDFLKSKGRRSRDDDSAISPEDLDYALERIARQGTHRFEGRIATLPEDGREGFAKDSFYGAALITVIAGMQATRFMGAEQPIEGATEVPDVFEYLDFINDKLAQTCRTIVDGDRIREPSSKSYEAIMTLLQQYYDMPNSPTFIDNLMTTLVPMYLIDIQKSGKGLADPIREAVGRITEECALMGLALPVDDSPQKLSRWYERAQAAADRIRQPGGLEEYVSKVIKTYERLNQLSLARLLVQGIVSREIVPSDLFEIEINMSLPQAEWTASNEPETDNTAEIYVAVDEYLEFEPLQPAVGTRPQQGDERETPEIVLDPRIPELDRKRVEQLVKNIMLPWREAGLGQVKLVARQLERRGTPAEPAPVIIGAGISETGGIERIENKYYIALLERVVELPNGKKVKVISAIGEHPRTTGKRHAIFAFDGRRGLSEQGDMLFTWEQVFLDKGTAYRMGAEKILHVGDPYQRALNMVRGDLKPLRRGREIGWIATETAMDGDGKSV